MGVGLGPLTVGIASDLLAPTFGAHSIRYSLMLAATGIMAAGVAFGLGASFLKGDMDRAGAARY